MYTQSDLDDVYDSFRKYAVPPEFTRFAYIQTFVKNAFSDGVISTLELSNFQRIEHEMLVEYQVAIDIWNTLPINSPQREAAFVLVEHFRRSNLLIAAEKARAQVKYESDLTTEKQLNKVYDNIRQEYRDSREVDKTITIALNPATLGLVNQVKTEKQRFAALLPEIKRKVANLTPHNTINIAKI